MCSSIIDPGVSKPRAGRGPGRGGAWRPRGAARTARACRRPAARRPRRTWRRARRAARGAGRSAPAPTRVQRGGGEAVCRRRETKRDRERERRCSLPAPAPGQEGGGGVWGLPPTRLHSLGRAAERRAGRAPARHRPSPPTPPPARGVAPVVTTGYRTVLLANFQ